MPSKYVVKEFGSDEYYHVFNRGVAKQYIFLDDQDKRQFLKILQRHLDPNVLTRKSDGLPYRKFNSDIELLCYCLMPNHLHLLIHQKTDGPHISEFLRAVSTAYVMYFNKRYRRVGPLFQGVYKASRITDDSYLLHITRYIHMNPKNYEAYEWSSLADYLKPKKNSWLTTKSILILFPGADYQSFLNDYQEEKELLETIKQELADQ